MCLIIFIAFLVSLGWATVWGFTNGNTAKITAPIDGDNKMCGYPNFESNTYLYFTKIDANILEVFKNSICVNECPSNVDDENTKLGTFTTCDNTAAVKDCAKVDAHNSLAVLSYCVPDITDMTDSSKAIW